MKRLSRIAKAAPQMLAALKTVRDANGDNKHFPAECMTAINSAIEQAEGKYEPIFEIIDGDLVEIKTKTRSKPGEPK